MATCTQCGRQFEQIPGRRVHFCSRACGRVAKAKPVRGILPRPCQQCGIVFKPHHRGQPGLFCSKPCAGLAKTKERPVRQCPQCERTFQCYGDRRFCSTQCANRWRAIHHLATLNGPPAWKRRHREMSRDYKLVQKAIARGELSLPEGWHVDDAAVQAWLQGRRQEIDGERERTKQYADRSGWPACLGPRRVQILNLLAHIGVPVSVKDMAATLKIRASSVHKQLVRLLREGWVIGLGLSRASFFTLGPIALTLQQERATCELFKHDTQ